MKRLLLLWVLACCWALAPAAERVPSVQRGLQALVALQHPDGSFAERRGVSALAGMALLAGGNTPTRGAYAKAVSNCLAHIIAGQDTMTGGINRDGGTQYTHGFATQFLAECYGMTPDDSVRTALVGAVGYILRSQNRQGGWRYDIAAGDADISVTVCQINALRAAWNAGVGGEAVPAAVGQALRYVRNCHNGDGSFRYMLEEGVPPAGRVGLDGVPRAAAGAMSLMGAGVYSLADPVLGAALDFLRRSAVEHAKQRGFHYWYGQYYAAQAMFQSGRASDWDTYWPTVSQQILSMQGADGLWRGPDDDLAYNTAMALLILQLPDQRLPMFQR